MPPLVVDVMNAHRAALLRRERTQMSAMAQRWLGVERALQAEIVRFTERLQQDGLTVGQMRSRQFQLDRFASLLRQVRVELDRYSDYAAPLITGQQREYAATGIDHAAAAINAVGEQASVIIKFDKLPVGAVENLVGLAGDGSPLRSLLQSSFGVGAEGMFNQLIAGVALGRNPQVVARMIVRDGLSQSLTRMMLIARTEQLRVYRESSRQTYISSGVVERYKRLASKSRRTCAACLMADGQIYELDEPFDEHPAGRCQLLPVVAGLPPVRWTEGRDWFTEQSPEVQRSILGPGRFDAWSAGAFDLDQLVSRRENPVWGGALVPTPLRDLLAGTAQPVTIRRDRPEPEPPAFYEMAERRRRAEAIAAEARAGAERMAAEERARQLAAIAQQTAGPFQYQPSAQQLERVTATIDAALARAAQRNRVPAEEFERGVKAGFEKLVSDKPLAIQFMSANMDRFLSDPRFKTQFETGSSGGALNQDYRANAEFYGLGAPLNLNPSDRPIYGYVNLGRIAQNQVSQYGDVTFILKDEVRSRSTVTMDDSLYNFAQSNVAGTPINSPGKASWDGQFTSLYKYNKSGDLGEIFEEISYVEIQIQGQVTISDVRGIIDRKGRLTAEQRRRLNQLGVEVWDD